MTDSVVVEIEDGAGVQNIASLASLLDSQDDVVVDPNTVAADPAVVEPTAEETAELAKAEEDATAALAAAKKDGVSVDEINELRGLLRELRNDNIDLKSRLLAAERIQKGEFGENTDTNKSDLEQYMEVYQAAAKRDFTDLIAAMEVNTKYEDLEVVCSGENFADIFDGVARFRSEQNKSDFTTELVKVKAEVWSLPNPYKYMYDTIKEFHPKYAKAPVTVESPAAPVAASSTPAATPPRRVVVAPSTVASMSSGDESKGGWTAERIDSLPESQLHTVPKDVYTKWLMGELD